MKTQPRPRWTTILSLLLVPLLVAGGFLWGTWNSDSRLREVQAAVVNLDEMVELNGQPTPLGRQLAAELVDSEREQNLTWVLADAKRAEEGLADGRYAAVVTIPKDFSKAATSFSGPASEAVQAKIRVETSPLVGINETALGQAIAVDASNALNRFLTGEYLRNIYLGFNDMGAQFMEMQDGTRQLADGAVELADGADQSASGAGELASGLGTASAAGGQLRSGADQSASGAGLLADGAAQLTTGAGDLATGTGELATGTTEFATGVATFADGVTQYTDGVAQYVGVVNPVIVQVRDIVTMVPAWDEYLDEIAAFVDALPTWASDLDARVQAFVARALALLDAADEISGDGEALAASVNRYAGAVADLEVACPAELAELDGGCEAFAEGVAAARVAAAGKAVGLEDAAAELAASGGRLDALIEDLRAAAGTISTVSSEVARTAPELKNQLTAIEAQLPEGTSLTKDGVLGLLDQFIAGGDLLVTGGTELASGATQLSDGAVQLASGVTQLNDGVGQFADGVGQFGSGVDQLAGGLGQLASGVGQYTRGIDSAATGSSLLAGGLGQLAGGAGQLADGVGQLADGVAEGADAIPTYSDAELENLAKVVASPIDTEGLGRLVSPGVAWASLLLVMALWLGALATYAALPAIDARNALSTRTSARLLQDTLLPGLAIVGAQAALLTVLGAILLKLPWTSALALGGVMLVAAATFVAVNHALAGVFGNGGRVVALAALVVTVVTAVTYAAPGVFGSLRPLSPVSPALDAVRAVMTGGSAMIPMLLMGAWLILGLSASAVGIARSRTVPLKAILV